MSTSTIDPLISQAKAFVEALERLRDDVAFWEQQEADAKARADEWAAKADSEEVRYQQAHEKVSELRRKVS